MTAGAVHCAAMGEVDICPVTRIVAVGALPRVVTRRLFVAAGAIDQAGMVEMDLKPVVGDVAV